VVSVTPRPQFNPGKDPVPIVQEAGWAPGPVWTGGKPRSHRDSIPDLPARRQSLYRLSYPAQVKKYQPYKLNKPRADIFRESSRTSQRPTIALQYRGSTPRLYRPAIDKLLEPSKSRICPRARYKTYRSGVTAPQHKNAGSGQL